ncbi:MAG: hypothetical protein SFT68_01680 [Rickettsiaceae bacterium]|nr:hypothetical protein [Rickettsiaceae bacterium]
MEEINLLLNLFNGESNNIKPPKTNLLPKAIINSKSNKIISINESIVESFFTPETVPKHQNTLNSEEMLKFAKDCLNASRVTKALTILNKISYSNDFKATNMNLSKNDYIVIATSLIYNNRYLEAVEIAEIVTSLEGSVVEYDINVIYECMDFLTKTGKSIAPLETILNIMQVPSFVNEADAQSSSLFLQQQYRVESLLISAYNELNCKSFLKAAEYFEDAIETSTVLLPIKEYLSYGYCLQNLQEYNPAILLAQKIISYYPDNIEAYMLSSWCFYKTFEYENAIDSIKNTIKIINEIVVSDRNSDRENYLWIKSLQNNCLISLIYMIKGQFPESLDNLNFYFREMCQYYSNLSAKPYAAKTYSEISSELAFCKRKCYSANEIKKIISKVVNSNIVETQKKEILKSDIVIRCFEDLILESTEQKHNPHIRMLKKYSDEISADYIYNVSSDSIIEDNKDEALISVAKDLSEPSYII